MIGIIDIYLIYNPSFFFFSSKMPKNKNSRSHKCWFKIISLLVVAFAPLFPIFPCLSNRILIYVFLLLPLQWSNFSQHIFCLSSCLCLCLCNWNYVVHQLKHKQIQIITITNLIKLNELNLYTWLFLFDWIWIDIADFIPVYTFF